jgi:hypothetical protein
MKILILWLSLLMYCSGFSAQHYPIIKAKNAKKFINKEVIVVGRLCGFSNSSYVQTGWLYLGPDTAHKQLEVVIQGENYGKGKGWIGNYIGKEIQIRGIVRKNNSIYLEATDTLKLK